MTTTDPQVSRDLALFCLDEAGRETAFISRLDYDPSDTYAVWLTFYLPQGDIRWAMGRELLSAGLTARVGEGDLRLAPEVDEEGRAVVRMDFRSPHGCLTARAHTRGLMEFLAHTYAVVPRDSEGEQYDLDTLVATLIASA